MPVIQKIRQRMGQNMVKASQGPPKPVLTSYTSKPVTLPSDFLAHHHAPPDLSLHPIDFEQTPLPEYAGSYAVVLENAFSASECAELLKYAEQSSEHGWTTAMVNGGIGVEYLATDYRSSDRIIWDEHDVVTRLWDRCLLAPGLKQDLEIIKNMPQLQGTKATSRGDVWDIVGLNERMRFLRYGPGNFFKAHCDGSYAPSMDRRTFYTFHLYLNDAEDGAGGATTFHSRDMMRRVDVVPKMGRVLIFQHAGLLHSGDTVNSGIKYTMRTDILYQMRTEN